MRIPRWSLMTAAAALVLPVAGPAIAAAATDGDVPLFSALTMSFSSEESEECEDQGEEAPDSEDPAVFAELSDTSEQGEDPCTDEGDGAPEDEDADPDQTPDDDPANEPDEDPNPDEATDDELADDGVTDDETAPEAEQLTHGALVSTVARCAPRGRDASELFGQRNHGAFVSAAAQGREIDVLGETFDLSTLDGAEALCAFVAEPPEGDTGEPEVDEQDLQVQDSSEETDHAADSRRAAGDHPGEAERAVNPGNANGGDGGGAATDQGGQGGPPSAGPSRDGGGNGGGPPAHAGKGGPNR